MNKRHFRPGVATLIGVVFLLLLWLVLAILIAQDAILPGPLSVAQRLLRDVQSPLFWSAVGDTATEAVLGSLCAAAVALPLAYVMYRSRFISAASEPLLALSQSIPAVALAPLLVIWVGYGLRAIVLLCALIVFFPILVNTVLGFRSLPREVLEAARLDGANSFQLLFHIEGPMALPAVLAGFRTGFTLSITGAVVGEFVMGGQGLGARLSAQSAAADMTGLFATTLVLISLAAVIFSGISILERQSRTLRALRDTKE
ncbi:hypothetical protein BSR29_04625 [Boudabousia liubingyangii]|uniref:ABC transmembrane type-1 domain-containing protein n=1 Tax=Boudabousia liubingyangii TaxID=1921764 RepID=A0A1Q5PNN9_9ACTO|nr:ABC transporter permease [Boudabousia liubingyangii]OKL47696.1 hypothetical protein BSR28_04190 [Boudabousia liubingyangii]OKL49122.1 hypothetical protein BSR29_04625 [Boudabousia liubingyangii]